jgi:AP endonuclease 1
VSISPLGSTRSSDLFVAGTAILSKQKALNVTYTLPDHPDPDIVKGRLITLEFENLWLIATYVPNAGDKLKVHSFCIILNMNQS